MRRPSPLLVSDAFDFFAVGGASLALPLFVAAYLRRPGYSGGDWLFGPSQILWYSLILPHYTSSYQLIYWDYAREIPRRFGYFAAAVVVPTACLAALASVFSGRPLIALSWLIHLLFFMSGWHYAKQAYGCLVALSAARGRPLKREEAMAARVNLLSLSVLSFIRPNQQNLLFPYGGFGYHTLGLPAWPGWIAGVVWAASAGVLVDRVARRLRRGEKPPWLAVAAFLSFYCWAGPLVLFPGIFHAFRDVPFVAALHSLQYLTFVLSLKLSRTPAPRGFDFSQLLPRFKVVVGLVGAAVLGQVVFVLGPHWADYSLPYDRALLGPVFFASSAAWFVNIHHYFIDSVVWRGNPELRALMARKAA